MKDEMVIFLKTLFYTIINGRILTFFKIKNTPNYT